MPIIDSLSHKDYLLYQSGYKTLPWTSGSTSTGSVPTTSKS